MATIQSEQDEIIRSPQPGVLVVQGGPGTGKTVVALHRAAYLLYTHRFPLEDQGVLVIGPNRVFLRYIERVLPSLGEAGVEQVVMADLVPDVRFGGSDTALTARVKGDARMSDLIDKAVSDRQRPLREDVVIPFRSGYIRLRADDSLRIVRAARRRFRRHNAGRRWVESEVWSAMAATWRDGDVPASEVRQAARLLPEVRAALDRMWPVLTPAQLLHDLFGSMALLRLAAGTLFDEREYKALYRPREEAVDDVRWSSADAALLDDAREVLGPVPRRNGKVDEGDEIRTYGHIVIDEVQDLTPMQMRMAARRSLNGSMTVVGDIAQATGPLAPESWDDVLATPARQPRAPRDRVVGRLPDPGPDHGARQPGDGRRHAGPAGADIGADRRQRHLRSSRVDDLFAGTVDALRSMIDELPGGGRRGRRARRAVRPRVGGAVRGRDRTRAGRHGRARRVGHGRAGERREGSRARRRHRGRAVADRRRRTARPARPLRGAHALDPATHRRPPRRPPRIPPTHLIS